MVDLSVHAGLLQDEGLHVIAASVDSVDDTNDLKSGLRLEFPLFAEIDAVAVARATGAFIEAGERAFMQATGFMLAPDGNVGTAVYATGPIGRITPTEILRALRFARAAASSS